VPTVISGGPVADTGATQGDDRHDAHHSTAQTIEPRGHDPPNRHPDRGPADRDLHLGNYVGAIRPLADLAVDLTRDVYVFVADLTRAQQPSRASGAARAHPAAVAGLLACGLDRPNVHVHRQSRVPAVAGMAAVLNNVAAKGLLNRTHAYKAAVAANVVARRDP
jgi:tRNA synthetases class I (W and Y)